VIAQPTAQPQNDVDEVEVDEETSEGYQEGYEEGYEKGHSDGINDLSIRTNYFPKTDQSNEYYRGYDHGYKAGYIEGNPNALKRPALCAGLCELPCLTTCFCVVFPLISIITCFSSIGGCCSNLISSLMLLVCPCTLPILCPTIILQLSTTCCSTCCFCLEAPFSLIGTIFCCVKMEFGSCCYALTGELYSHEIGGLVGMCTERLGICCMQAGW